MVIDIHVLYILAAAVLCMLVGCIAIGVWAIAMAVRLMSQGQGLRWSLDKIEELGRNNAQR
jgi:uncharacterized membrane protein YpjA